MSHLLHRLAYSDPTRERDPHALPDVEVFHVSKMEATYNLANSDRADDYTITEPGWYWWPCFPGCIPDGAAIGPYETERKALRDAQNAFIPCSTEERDAQIARGMYDSGADVPQDDTKPARASHKMTTRQ